MKKWKILIPSLVATASMPLVGLVGCNKEESEQEPIPDQTIILDNYNYGGEYVCATQELPGRFEKNKTYCFRINLSVIDTSYDDFFDGYGWLFYFDFSADFDLSKADISVYKNNIKQRKYNQPTTSSGLDGYCLTNTDVLYLYSYHINTPPLKNDLIKVYFKFKEDVNNNLFSLKFEKYVAQ